MAEAGSRSLDGDGIDRSRVTGSGFHEFKALSAEIEQQLKR